MSFDSGFYGSFFRAYGTYQPADGEVCDAQLTSAVWATGSVAGYSQEQAGSILDPDTLWGAQVYALESNSGGPFTRMTFTGLARPAAAGVGITYDDQDEIILYNYGNTGSYYQNAALSTVTSLHAAMTAGAGIAKCAKFRRIGYFEDIVDWPSHRIGGGGHVTVDPVAKTVAFGGGGAGNVEVIWDGMCHAGLQYVFRVTCLELGNGKIRAIFGGGAAVDHTFTAVGEELVVQQEGAGFSNLVLNNSSGNNSTTKVTITVEVLDPLVLTEGYRPLTYNGENLTHA